MNIKFLNLSTKKFISILCAVAILMASLPLSALLMKVNAAEGEIIDFQGEDAGDIVAGNDHFTIGGQDNADKEYFYASNTTDKTITLTVNGLQLQAGKKYTVSLDLYSFGVSKDNNSFGIKVYGDTAVSGEGFVANSNLSIEEWTSYNFEFTAKEGSTKLDFSALAGATALIEDFAIVDENGNKVEVDLTAACDAYNGDGTFTYGTLAQLIGSTAPVEKVPGYKLVFAGGSEQAFATQGITRTEKIGISFDYYLVKGSARVDVRNGNSQGGAYIKSLALGYGSVSVEAPVSSGADSWRIISSEATELYIYNVKVTGDGNEVEFKKRDDRTTCQFTSVDAVPGATSGDTSGSVDLTAPAYKMTYDSGEAFRTSYDKSKANTATIKFDYYLKSGRIKVYGSNNESEAGYLQAGVNSFELSANSPSFWIAERDGADELYIWNVELTQDGSPMEFKSYEGRTTCEFEKITLADVPNIGDLGNSGSTGGSSTPSQPTKSNYAIYFDSTTKNNFWVTKRNDDNPEIGMEELNLPAGNTYTVEFDLYALTLGHRVVFGATTATWSTDAAIEGGHQVWKEAPTTVEEWTHYSFNVTTTATWKGILFYVIQDASAFKGYIDNLTIKDAAGTVVASFNPTEAELEKSSNCAKVVKLPSKIDPEYSASLPGQSTVENYKLLIDTTSVTDNGTDNKNFWFNELGMPGYKGKLESGKTYTVSFDVYPIKMPTSNNLFHYRTSSGSASSNAGWWKPEFELNKWQNTTHTFKVEDASKSGHHILYVYGGFKGYIDNFKLLDENNNVVEGTATDFTGLEIKKQDYNNYLKIEKEKTSSALPVQPTKSNYAIYFDSTSKNNFWVTKRNDDNPEIGMEELNLPAGNTYTVEFDLYSLTLGHRVVFGATTATWSTDAAIEGGHQVWKEAPTTVEEWTHYSFNVTTTATWKGILFYVIQDASAFKGYIDNLTIKDATGTVVAAFEPTEADLEKSSNCAKVVKLPNKIDPEYVPSGNLSGLEIAILKGKAGKDGASISLGGAKSPLTIESNKTYKLIFKYYQANPTASGELNLFAVKFIESALGKANDVTWFKKNSTDGWTEVKVIFSAGNIENASADWFQLVLNPNAWVFFDDFTLEETEVDNNKEVSKITFDQKDDSIYPKVEVEDAVFEWSSDMGGTFKAVNATEYTNTSKNSNRQISFKNIKMKSNTSYEISIDYYNEAPITDYAAAFGYNASNLGNGSGNQWKFINNIQSTGWHTVSLTITTGEVIPNANYFNLVCYDVNDSSEPRTIWFDNFTITEQYTIETSLNDKTLGTVTKTFGAQAGDNVRVVANAFEGATFEGWYEYGDLVSTDAYYRLNNLDDNHKLEARFSGKAKPGTVIVQGFEDYELGDIGFEYYEIVSDSKNVLEGNKSLHVKPGKIMESIETSIFFPVVSNKEYQMKDDYTYDVYVWVKAPKKPENVHYYAFLGANSYDQSDMLSSGNYWSIGVSTNIKPDGSKAVEEKDGWYRYLLGTVTKDHTDRDGFAFQICKFHANRAEGASVDDIYIDRVEVVERTPDFENLKFTEKFFNEVSNPNFEEEITDENWGPLTDGVTVQEITDKEFDWQGNYNLKFDAAASNGKEYVRVIPLSKQGKNYTFAAWTKLSKGSDITVGLYSNGEYVPFDDVMNGETGKLKLIDNEKWNRVNFSFNSGDSKNAYLVIKGTKGTLELDMVNIFVAERGFIEDPNTYGDYKTAFQETDPIAFPDKITTEEVLVEEGQEATNNKKYLITKEWVGPNVLVIVLSIVGGVLAAAAIAIVLIIVLAKKRKKN